MAAAAVGTETTNSGTSASFTCAYPTVVDGTLLIAAITADGAATVTPPTGFKRFPRMGGHTGFALVDTHWMYYKIADGTETGTATFASSASRHFAMAIYPVSGANRYMPFCYVRTDAGSNDRGINNLASRIANGLGMVIVLYESLADETGQGMTGGAAASWTNIGGVDGGGGDGVVAYTNTASFASTTFGAGGTTWDAIAGFTDAVTCAFVINSNDEMAEPVSLSWLYRAGGQSGSSAVTSMACSSDTDGGIQLDRCMILPGVTVVGALLSNSETATISDWDTDISAKEFTQVAGSMYDHTGASPTLSLGVGYAVFGEEDCYSTSTDDITATFSSSVAELILQSYYVEDAALKLSVKEGTFETVDTATTAPDPASITTLYDDTLVITINGRNGSVAATQPTGYTKAAEALNGSSTFGLTAANKKVDVAGAEDPGVWTTGNVEHVMYTLGITKTAVNPPESVTAPAVTPVLDPDVDDILETTDGTWTGAPTFTYAWQRSNDGVGGWAAIGGATSDTYTLVSADQGKFIRCAVTATNAGGSLTIGSNVVGAIGAQLTVTSPSFPSVSTGSYFDQQGTTPSGGTAPYTYAVQSGALPSGLSLSASTGRITGVPNGAAGASTFVIRVTDAQAQTEDTGTLSITVIVPAIAIDTPRIVDGRVGRLYDFQLRASGGVPPYTFSVVSGALATGLSLSSSGRISGTPTASGAYRARIRVTDSAASTREADF